MSTEVDHASRADERVREIGVVLGGEVAALSAVLHERLATAIKELQTDEVLLDLLYASIESNLETLVHILRYDLSILDAGPPAAAAEYARRLAQRGISATALVRAYRLGQQLVVDWGFDQLGRIEPDRGIALLAGQRFAAFTFDYIDSISEGIVDEYELERERWVAHRTTVRTDTIEQIVAGRDVSVPTAEQVLGYRLLQYHVGVTLWTTETETSQSPQQPQLAGFLAAIAEELGARGKPLFHSRDHTHAWGWIPLDRAPSLPHRLADRVLEAGVGMRASLGVAAPGVEGFRTSHLDARRARRVAMVAGADAPQLTSYDEVEVRTAALFVGDLEHARRTIAYALGGLAADTPAAARLRDTLLAFLTEKSSYLATAERVHLHKNTVKYRVERAVEERGRPLDDERLELEMALVACRRLGAAVLVGPA